ncbi:ATP-dependent DNA ligase [Artomyces pyxidatus]|uniref:ATP-dependent DNA ligase n=1 Tax=Artomyces pyxidatus TaxID=48021 RepID=A0ACB8T233_9AGAM|nr:ATP-dependent DNA ligase [Artomyces pyxidatus]
MPKRPASSPSTPRKKSKRPPDQPSLDSFFKSPRDTPTPTRKRQTPQLRDAHAPEPPPAASQLSPPEIIDVDLLDDSDIDTRPIIPSSSSISQGPRISDDETPRIFSAGVQPHPPKYPSLSEDPTTFLLDSCFWTPNTPTPYSFLAHTLTTVSETRSRIAIINTLTNALRQILRFHPKSLLPSLYLLSNSLSPPYSPIELGLGPSIISKAIQHVSGLTPAALKRLYNQTGDPGDVAFEAKSSVRTLVPHPPLLTCSVYDALLKIAHAKGQGAVKQKQSIVEKLLVAAKGEEIRFLVRTLSQHIRVGAVRTSILTALARALVLTPPNSDISAPSDSPYRISEHILSQIQALPAGSSKKVVDEAKEKLVATFAAAEGLIKKVFVQHPNYDHIVAALLEAGLDGLTARVPLTVGIPLHPTLGSPMRSLDEVYERIDNQPFVAEFKYDGQRAQIHAFKDKDGKVSTRLFSRHLEDMTDKYPDVTSLVEHMFASSQGLESFIMDAEVVAVDPSDGSLRSFQELSNRPRKEVQVHEIKVSVCVFAFDLMYHNRQASITLQHRRTLLRSDFPPVDLKQPGSARFEHVESCHSEDGKETVEEFWLRAVDSRCEGLMIKLLDHGVVVESSASRDKSRKKPLPATYEPDRRTSAWLKLKKDYVIGLGDTLDLVPVGAWHGNGRKAQWWSPVLLALRDPDTGQLVAMCKCMSGFSDAFYKAMKEVYAEDSENCSRQALWEDVDTGGYSPSVYFRPHEVWEIRGADVTLSPVSIAARGLVSDSRGLSLRFPRFIKTREDKSIEQASSPEFLANIFRDQQGKGKHETAGADDGQLVDVELSQSDDVEDDDSDGGELT